MKRWWLIAGAVVLYLIFVVVSLPAKFGLWFVPAPQNVHVGGVSGTVWQGHIQVIHWQGKIIKDLHWDMNVAALFGGSVELDLTAGQDMTSDIAISGVAGTSFSGWYVENLTFSLPASIAAELSPMPIQVELQGQVDGTIEHASQGVPWCSELAGDVVWRNPAVAAAALGRPLQLDETRAKLSCADGDLVAAVEDDKRVLGLALTAQVGQQEFSVSGTMEPGPGFPQGYIQALMFVATPQGGNSYKIEFDGTF
ncbi:type II secretion system protein N [Neiella marina]|uniref:Type II secretion system protein N n=1 Tax=Neiella holothuriorum TaxID=2870530 RepID=A0ABS7EG12_9GAMM|nr:type II secretion system protein N [Neiella holothuriorum]MBW8191266.1 type II secretion system protein N [Neiella holothuriorum]